MTLNIEEEDIAFYKVIMTEFDVSTNSAGKVEIANLITVLQLIGLNPKKSEMGEIEEIADPERTGFFMLGELIEVLKVHPFKLDRQ